jgi:hypothetical protein
MTSKPHDVWYSHARWRRRRLQQLREHPLCVWCAKRGKVTAAVVAHHAQPHHGDRHMFWTGTLISLCKLCHDSDAQRIEKGGTPRQTIGVDGWPIE